MNYRDFLILTENALLSSESLNVKYFLLQGKTNELIRITNSLEDYQMKDIGNIFTWINDIVGVQEEKTKAASIPGCLDNIHKRADPPN